MIDGKSVLAIIPARGGSKGIPRKNLVKIRGKSLIAWSIDQAKDSAYIDRLILSSEDREIIDEAVRYGCDVPFVRPAELAADDTPGIAPVLHAVQQLPNYDYVVLLQPTSPMRSVKDIDGCIQSCVNGGATACVSVVETDKNPYWMYFMREQNRMTPVIQMDKPVERRQDVEPIYAVNGAVYVAQISWLLQQKTFVTPETKAYVMPKIRSFDIDTITDLTIIRALMEGGAYLEEIPD